jgi:ABC-type Fe3+-hydroxamate transport system substrate-binding protein
MRGLSARPGSVVDASGVTLALPHPPRRIVSLVPSLTELLFVLGVGESLAGCTTYCTEPAEGLAKKARIGGEKNPDLEGIRALGADLVIANIEENLREHVETLRGWGLPVFVCYPRTVAEAIDTVRTLGALAGAVEAAARLADDLATRLARTRAAVGARRRLRVFCPIWRRPWMTVSRDTYVHDMLTVCGGDNVFADHPGRYPTITLEDVAAARPDVILLPDEPYRFRHAHIADFEPFRAIPALRDGRIHLLDGKLLTWYGPRIAEALEVLPSLLGTA